MKRAVILIACVLAFVYFKPSSSTNFCIGGLLCSADEIKISQRLYEPQAGRFVLEGEIGDEFHHFEYRLEDEQIVEKLSFGVRDVPLFADYSAVKGIHILRESAVKIYYEKYVIPGKGCPASFMNQNLETLMLLPVDENMTAQLEAYDIPFDGRGTPFRLRGHYMHDNGTYFIDDGKRYNLKLTTHESVMSNFGSASHAIRYFLVTEIEPEGDVQRVRSHVSICDD